jgi:hypothetical protein
MGFFHIVRAGEGLDRIAYEYGHFPGKVWSAPENDALRTLRVDGNILMPGDRLFIPDKVLGEVAAATGRRHRFRRRGVPAKFRLQVFRYHEPRAGEPWRLDVDGREHTGTTDADGVIEIFIPPDAVRGSLVIGDDERPIALWFGELHPVTEPSGVQQRLRNLGFLREPQSGATDDATREALRGFQRRVGLEESGEADEPTRAALVRWHDTRSGFPGGDEGGAS